jgi:predicted house-cleaning noncanonical NTP pyrophosphatase (MazG superfamily)
MNETRLSGEPVRHLLPARLEAEGYRTEVRSLDDTGFTRALRSRLQEEIRSYMTRPSLETLAELAELVEALAEVAHSDDERSLLQVRQQLQSRDGSYQLKQVMTLCEIDAAQAPALSYEAEDAVIVDPQDPQPGSISRVS